MPDDDKLVSEFADEIRQRGGPENLANDMARARGWTEAFCAAHEAADEHSANVVRAIYSAAARQGINMMWPLRFGEPPEVS